VAQTVLLRIFHLILWRFTSWYAHYIAYTQKIW